MKLMSKTLDCIDNAKKLLEKNASSTKDLYLICRSNLFSKEQMLYLYHRYQGINVYFIKHKKLFLLQEDGSLREINND